MELGIKSSLSIIKFIVHHSMSPHQNNYNDIIISPTVVPPK